MTDLAGRIHRRILTELGGTTDDYFRESTREERNGMVDIADAAHLAALEAEDSANPIAQTEQVRPPLRLNIDIAAFQAVYDDLDHE